MPRLPPLPHRSAWQRFLTRALLGAYTATGQLTHFRGRVLLTRPDVAEEFVRALKLREGEVVIEALGGPGVITRSLLDGGRNIPVSEWIERAKPWQREPKDNVIDPATGAEPFPLYSLNPQSSNAGEKVLPTRNEPAFASSEGVVLPKLVVAVEPSAKLLSRGLGMPFEAVKQIEKSMQGLEAVKKEGDTRSRYPFEEIEEGSRPCPVYQSEIEDRLAFAPVSVAHWRTLPEVLSNPIVQAALPVYDESGTGVERTTRPWSAEPPPITIVATLPTKEAGEALSINWLNSLAGAADGKPAWIWKYGRIRLALLADLKVYERLMATPGTQRWQAHTVKFQALWKASPLPPYFHAQKWRPWQYDEDGKYDPNARPPSPESPSEPLKPLGRRGRPAGAKDKSTRVYGEEAKQEKRRLADAVKAEIKTGGVVRKYMSPTERTTIHDISDGDWTQLTPHHLSPDDFFPARKAKSGGAPALMGLLLEPRLDTPIRLNQRDMWDYVLRRSFTRPEQEFGTALKSIAFGAERLADQIEAEDSPYLGTALDRRTKVNMVTLDQWQRVIEVFAAWPFRPSDAELIESHFGNLPVQRNDVGDGDVDEVVESQEEDDEDP